MSPASASARRSSATPGAGELRERILSATRDLLAQRRFEALSVADILAAAGVSRASFYFYFPSKQAVLAELVRQAVAGGQQAARPWIEQERDPVEALAAGVRDGARLWHDNAGVLTAIVEHMGADDALRALWIGQMELFTEAAAARITADPRARRHLGDRDVRPVAAALTWLGERLYYLAAAGVPPFDDQDVLVDTLTNAWTSTLYGEAAPPRRASAADAPA